MCRSWYAVRCFSGTFLVLCLNMMFDSATVFTAACSFESGFRFFAFGAGESSNGDGGLMCSLISPSGVLSSASFVCASRGVFGNRCFVVSWPAAIFNTAAGCIWPITLSGRFPFEVLTALGPGCLMATLVAIWLDKRCLAAFSKPLLARGG